MTPLRQSENPTTAARRRYIFEFAIATVAYVVVLLGSRMLWRDATGAFEIVVALLPMVPLVFVFAAVVRYILNADELQRQMLVESLAIAGGVTMLITLTYGFLEGDPLPRPSAWWVYVVFMAAFAVSALIVRRRYQ